MFLMMKLGSHDPQQIYDFLYSKFGPVNFIIENGKIKISFQKQQNVDIVIKRYQDVEIAGNKVHWFKYSENEGLKVEQEEEEENIDDFSSLTQAEKTLHQGKSLIKNSIENIFDCCFEAIKNKLIHYSDAFKQKAVFQKEIMLLAQFIKKKLLLMANNLKEKAKKLSEHITTFVSTPIQIDLEASYRTNHKWSFPSIEEIKNFQLKFAFQHKSLQQLPIKRFCSINGNDWAVTAKDKKSNNGIIRLYSQKVPEYRQCFEVNDGAYAIEATDDYIFSGSYKNSINFINLRQQKLKVEGFKLGSQECIIIGIKRQPKRANIRLGVLSKGLIRLYDVSSDEIVPGIESIYCQKKLQFPCSADTFDFAFSQNQEILFGSPKLLTIYNIEKQKSNHLEAPYLTGWKIKQLSDSPNFFAITAGKKISLIDFRNFSIVHTFPERKAEINSLETIPSNTIVYGSDKQIGIFDYRKGNSIIWSNSLQHQSKITDIIKSKNRVLSGDVRGYIYSWKSHYY